MMPTVILAKVEGQRLQKAVDGLVSGSYKVTLTSQSEAEIRGFVANRDGQEDGVVLSEGRAFCSCKDAMYRKSVCKHAVVMALFAIRNPQRRVEVEEETRPYNLSLGKTRKGFAFSA